VCACGCACVSQPRADSAVNAPGSLPALAVQAALSSPRQTLCDGAATWAVVDWWSLMKAAQHQHHFQNQRPQRQGYQRQHCRRLVLELPGQGLTRVRVQAKQQVVTVLALLLVPSMLSSLSLSLQSPPLQQYLPGPSPHSQERQGQDQRQGHDQRQG
jgi:hypothetical protein